MIRGKNLAYGYWFQGGLSQYSRIGPDIYASDIGNNLIKVQPEKGYAEIALTEPWACVVAAYALDYRTAIKPGGSLWVIGTGEDRPYRISAGFDETSHPSRLLMTDVPPRFADWLLRRSGELGIEVDQVPDLSALPLDFVDDIALLGADPSWLEKASPHLDHFGVIAIMAQEPMPRKAQVDVGRIHYHRWVYVGSSGLDVAAAYQESPVRTSLKPGGRYWPDGTHARPKSD